MFFMQELLRVGKHSAGTAIPAAEPTLSSTFSWPRDSHGSVYNLVLKRGISPDTGKPGHVDCKVVLQETGERVAYVRGYVLQRPNEGFLEEAAGISEQLEKLATLFCTPDGIANRIEHPLLDATAINGGGFFYVETMEVNPISQGLDLGLRVLQECLVLLQGSWTLTVLVPDPLPAEKCCDWGTHCVSNGQITRGAMGRRRSSSSHLSSSSFRMSMDALRRSSVFSAFDEAEHLEEDMDRDFQAALARHFARMGFVPAGKKTTEEERALFLTASSYDPSAPYTSKQYSHKHNIDEIIEGIHHLSEPIPDDPLPNRASKDHIHLHHHHVPYQRESSSQKHERSWDNPLDKELYNAVISFPVQQSQENGKSMNGNAEKHKEQLRKEQGAALEVMENLVEQGASVNESGALQAAAANLNAPLVLFEVLLQLGGDVDYQDPQNDKNTVLHVAAGSMNKKAVKYLVNVADADIDIVNQHGETPMQCYKRYAKSVDDMWTTFVGGGGSGAQQSFPPLRESDVLPHLECLLTLTPEEMREEVLIDDWLSPRMLKMLQLTAERTMDECFDMSYVPRIEYIPAAVFSSNPKLLKDKGFNIGWFYVWSATNAILQQEKPPTVTNIENYLKKGVNFDSRTYRRFCDQGGKVEYAVDALINITRNIRVRKIDEACWDYDECKAEIEAFERTPFDDAFDIVRLKCIHQGGGDGTQRGPYSETLRLVDSESEGFVGGSSDDGGGLDDDDFVF